MRSLCVSLVSCQSRLSGPSSSLSVPRPIGAVTAVADANTTPVNLANLPALSVPVGETEDGLPVGLQLVGPAFDEHAIVRAGSALEN